MMHRTHAVRPLRTLARPRGVRLRATRALVCSPTSASVAVGAAATPISLPTRRLLHTASARRSESIGNSHDVDHQQHQQQHRSSSSHSSYLASLLGVVGVGGLLVWLNHDSSLLPVVYAAEGDSKLTEGELDLARSRDEDDSEEHESSPFQLNADGDIEWMSTSTRPRIVVLGTGWGSVSFLKSLDINKYEIVVISPRNYFLFTPLLPSACTGTLEMGSLTEPIRQILLHRHKTHQNQYIEAKAVGLDRDKRKVQCVDSNGRSFLIEYDHLIIGVGANNNTFNTPGVKDYAFFLKEAKHARIIRKHILEHFERASSPTTTLEEKEKLLQFVIVGGGPTGVEFAGELVDFLDSDLKEQFPYLIPYVRVRLIQSQEHILNTYDEAISRYAEEKFRQLRIEVITNARVKAIAEHELTYEDKATHTRRTIPFGICLWSTGIEMNAFTQAVSQQVAGQESEKALVTDEHLRLLREIPHLDRVQKRIVKAAAASVEASATSDQAGPTIAPLNNSATPVVTPTTTSSGKLQQAQAASAAGSGTGATSPASQVKVQAQADAKSNAKSQAEDEDPVGRELNVDPRIYALGDCATTYIPKLSKRMKAIFKAADINQDGRLSYTELRNLCYTISRNFPVMSAQMAMIMHNYTLWTQTDAELSLSEFEKMLLDADKSVRAYPATAQVASQQGHYLAAKFNDFAAAQIRAGKMRDVGGEDHANLEQKLVKEGIAQRQVHPPITPTSASMDTCNDATCRPFRYRHLGNLAYIGGETAAIDLGKIGVFTGNAAFWLWKSAYLSKSVSTRTRMNLAYDWTKTKIFGRDTSKP